MPYKAECPQTDCEFVVHRDTDQEAVDALTDHTDEAHANMDILEEEVRESVTRIE